MPKTCKFNWLSAAIVFLALVLAPGAALAGQATLAWKAPAANTDGTALSNLGGYKVHYGTQSGAYSKTVDVGNVTTHTVSSLSAGKYYFAVTAYNTAGKESSYSSEGSKTVVSDVTAPVISGAYAGSLTTSTAKISWVTDEAATTQVEYGLTTSYGYASAKDAALILAHNQTITGLAPGTTYNFRVKSADESGNEAVSGNYTFTTAAPPDTTPPVVTGIEVTNVTLSSAVVMWKTDEPATSQVDFGTGGSFTASTPLKTGFKTVHSVALEGLQSFSTYNFRVVSSDSAGNTVISGTRNFTTPNQAPTVDSFGVSASSGMAPLQVEFTAAVTDPDGVITGYEWDFDGDGVYDLDTGASPTATHTYQSVGTYQARVKATDSGGASIISEPQTISVESAVNKPPVVVSIVGTVTQNGSGVSITFDVKASDPNGVIVKFEWDFDGNGTIDAVTTSAPAQYEYDLAGDYSPIVKVSDNQGAAAYATTTVSVPEAAKDSGAGSVAGSQGSGGGGGCFIATAAFGSYLDPEVRVLRDFRDGVLLENPIGRAFVDAYYRFSPAVADVIARHEGLRLVTRLVLTPIVYGIKYPDLAASFGMIMIGIVAFVRMNRRRVL